MATEWTRTAKPAVCATCFLEGTVRVLALVLLAYTIAPLLYAQQKVKAPTDGNDLLEHCSVLIEVADSPTSFDTSNESRLIEQVGKFNWCAGYLGAIRDDLIVTRMNLGLFAMGGMTFAGPDKLREYALDSPRFACIPDAVPILQMGRVLVKWLRDHPERLHEPKNGLVRDALKEAFPCPAATPPTEPAKPAAAKP